MTAHFSPLDSLVLAAYFAMVIGIGLYFRRRSQSVEGFTAAERTLPGWVTGLSIFASYVSSISFLALPGKAFASNWNAFVFSLSLPVAAWVAVRWFLPFYRGSGELSAYQHLEHRFGPWARIYANLCCLLTHLARIGAITYLMALPMRVFLGWDIRVIILLTGICVTLYAFTGGILAVIWNDALQSLVLIAGALGCLALMVFGLPGGVAQLWTVAQAHDKFSFGSFGSSLAEPTVWVVLVYGIVVNLQNFGIDQTYVQRYLVSKSDREARKSVWLGALLYVPVSAMFFLIGTTLFVYYTTHPGGLPATYWVPGGTDSAFPFFIATALPVGMKGLLVAAIFAAAMGAISSSLNASATIIMTDYYRRYFNPRADERQSMRALRIATLAFGLAGTAIALALIHVKDALDAWWTLSGIFGGGVLGLFLLGFISRRVTNAAAFTGVLLGVILILWMTLSPNWTGSLAPWRSPFHSFLIIVFGTLAILFIGLIVSRFRRAGGQKP